MIRLDDFLEGTEPCARQTEHFKYSEVFLREYPETLHYVIGSVEPIDFADMAKYWTQADAYEDSINEQGLVKTGTPLTWSYINDPADAPDPGSNPVRSPFLFEVGFEIEDSGRTIDVESEFAGRYHTRTWRPLRVASVLYEGSFPHQENSGFAESWMTLVTQAPVVGYALTGGLYRELYHHIDYEDVSRSVTEIQVEIVEVV